MTDQGLDVRNSTLSALKISCPSAEVLDSPFHSDRMGPNPFLDADTEWSDEEELIPKSRRKTQYVPPNGSAPSRAAAVAAAEHWPQSSSSENSPSPNRNSGRPLNGSPLIPPKSPSRPDIRPGSSQDDLVERFYQVTRERDALRKQLQRKSMGAHGIPREQSVIYKSDEKSLIEELQALRYEIRSWSEQYFSGPPSSRSRRPHVHSSKELFGTLTDNYQTYLKHSQDRPLLIQAFVWSRLQHRIFSNLFKGCGYVWAGKLGERKLRPINDTLRKAVKNEEDAEEYHRWRAMTVNLLVPQVDGKWRPTFDAAPVLKRISRFCSRLRRKLRPFATQSLRHGKDQLRTIVSAAVALDLKMKRQRADYRFVTFTGGKSGELFGYGFYDSEMEDIEEDNDKPRRVELSLAPALERCGNANGYVFDQNFILVKADVSCKRLEKKRPPRKPRENGYRAGMRTLSNLWNY
ncbi:uncharacterized protein BDR25DRAFT_323132 [Lindgomyces ingoldianus]|uniref:Uncharacterized protein n=1 Tax=Lindgomyces ingoldianus TaxID=673940 RepID=A0ACB6R4R0_9PLEO|nr:uncharacterized protein BDR25DRAFT_323132 [Lindgomyces ingoldianus]KAF2474060.1 hypothetical protein BDR25DRAFT_323132 [Lindgomyces ingoldianus]